MAPDQFNVEQLDRVGRGVQLRVHAPRDVRRPRVGDAVLLGRAVVGADARAARDPVERVGRAADGGAAEGERAAQREPGHPDRSAEAVRIHVTDAGFEASDGAPVEREGAAADPVEAAVLLAARPQEHDRRRAPRAPQAPGQLEHHGGAARVVAGAGAVGSRVEVGADHQPGVRRAGQGGRHVAGHARPVRTTFHGEAEAFTLAPAQRNGRAEGDRRDRHPHLGVAQELRLHLVEVGAGHDEPGRAPTLELEQPARPDRVAPARDDHDDAARGGGRARQRTVAVADERERPAGLPGRRELARQAREIRAALLEAEARDGRRVGGGGELHHARVETQPGGESGDVRRGRGLPPASGRPGPDRPGQVPDRLLEACGGSARGVAHGATGGPSPSPGTPGSARRSSPGGGGRRCSGRCRSRPTAREQGVGLRARALLVAVLALVLGQVPGEAVGEHGDWSAPGCVQL